MGNIATQLEREVGLAVAEGLVDRAHAAQLIEDARRLARSPLELLCERGMITEGTLASLQLVVRATGSQEYSTSATGKALYNELAFPVADWDRYEPIRLLGQGAMGRVFLVRDHRLRRDVAIKFMRGDDAELARRFVAEARAHARVRHPHVCEVYEVGEVEGKVYIAMQHIDGRSLGDLRGELTVEQIAMLVRGAALGVNEAHRAGLIHRDLKPSNIMVERTDDGALRPYVMDFGLARDWNESSTVTGTVLGTPHFMAPEQARGEVSRLDRRADVYSLGATLYALLTGEPPVPGAHPLEVLANVASVEPRPPRALHRDIPADLEAITLKCLEKDRSARYDSARSLADDLDRFLAGEPVAVRARGLGYRLLKRLRKHARLVAAAAVALVIVSTALGYAAHTSGQSARREELARRFTERVERIEAQGRYAQLSRLHDARADRAKLRAEMDALAEDVRAAGASAAGPGHYALGRGWLALGDDDRAEHELAAAWREGFHTPRAAYALALATGHLYQRALRAAERLPTAAPRDQRRRALERRYRDPALVYLRDSRGADVPSVDYVEALVAFYEGRFDASLERLDAIDRGGAASWFYEAPLLRGEVLRARAGADRQRHDDARANADVAASRQAFLTAATVGESDPAVHEALGDLEANVVVHELYSGGAVEAPYQHGLAAAVHALTIDPDRYEALALRTRLQHSMVSYRGGRGEDVTGLVTTAIADATRAVELAPGRSEARLALAQIWRQWGEIRQGRSEDPTTQLGKAIEIADTIPATDRDDEYFVLRGLTFNVWADYEDQRGRDSAATRDRAIDAYTRALALDDKLAYIWFNLGGIYHDRAGEPHDRDIDGDIERAITAFERGQALDANNIAAYFYGGRLHLLRAQRQRDAGGDPGPELARALARYREGLAIDASRPQIHSGIGSVLAEQAENAWNHGEDPFPLFDAAEAAYARAAEVAPALGLGDKNLGWALAARAKLLNAHDDDPGPAVRAAEVALRRAIARAPGDEVPWATLGDAFTTLAGYELNHDRDPTASLARARAALDHVKTTQPQRALVYDGEAKAIAAEWNHRVGRDRPEEFAAAAAAYDQALARDPLDQVARLRVAAFCRRWAAWLQDTGGDPTPVLHRGLDLVTEVLAKRPAWPDALVVHASLLLSQAQHAHAPASRDLARRAAEGFHAALAINPRLLPAWRAATREADLHAAAAR
ncbi:MAG TPA: serine/threonine-protein kinase [Kofleriaceae bacterium]|nr:serine/threonine-protein kinase [Kofleriaceae bacterium]